MPQDQLSMQCSLPKSIIGNIVNCQYDSVELHIIHEICRGLKINIQELFTFHLFDDGNLEPQDLRRPTEGFVYT